MENEQKIKQEIERTGFVGHGCPTMRFRVIQRTTVDHCVPAGLLSASPHFHCRGPDRVETAVHPRVAFLPLPNPSIRVTRLTVYLSSSARIHNVGDGGAGSFPSRNTTYRPPRWREPYRGRVSIYSHDCMWFNILNFSYSTHPFRYRVTAQIVVPPMRRKPCLTPPRVPPLSWPTIPPCHLSS